MNINKWAYQAPIYVTREYKGEQGGYFAALWIVLIIQVLVLLNAVGWGIYGLIALIQKVLEIA